MCRVFFLPYSVQMVFSFSVLCIVYYVYMYQTVKNKVYIWKNIHVTAVYDTGTTLLQTLGKHYPSAACLTQLDGGLHSFCPDSMCERGFLLHHAVFHHMRWDSVDTSAPPQLKHKHRWKQTHSCTLVFCWFKLRCPGFSVTTGPVWAEPAP